MTSTSASATYTNKLKLHTLYVTMAPKQAQINCSPQAHHTKLANLAFVAAATQKSLSMSAQSAPQNTPTAMASTTTLTSTPPTFGYQAKLKCITLESKTILKAKLKAVIANLQSLVDTLKKKFEQKLNQ